MIIPSLKLTTTRSSFVSVSKYYSRMSNQFTILSDDKTIEKPLLDDRSYRFIKLNNNGLRVLLINDPTTDKAAASLDVNVGSFTDKEYNISGLAHFCEHLLFMGTEKYPKENEYSNYLSKHSGSSNAYTAAEHTNYYFQVGADYLEGALDRFSQFFIAPLFSKSCQDREINAVDSENKKNLQSDMWRLYQLDKFTSNSAHPYSGFSTGNYQTLHTDPVAKGVDVRDILIDFHKQHYSSNLMSLVILGKEDLNTLTDWAIEKFSAVPNKDLSRPNYNGELVYKPQQLGKLIKAKPIMDNHKMELNFLIPDDLEDKWDTKPNGYFSHLVGHESKGSIIYYLKQKGWATDLSAGAMTVCQGTSNFYIEFQLTPKGFENWQEIIVITFQYLNFITNDEPQKWIWDEIEEMSQVNFKFKQKMEASKTVSTLSNKLYKFDEYIPASYLLSSAIVRKFDPEAIKRFGSYFTPENLRITLASQLLTGLNKQEKWYGTEYEYDDIPQELIHQIKSQPYDNNQNLHYPRPNHFIPTNFDVTKPKLKHPQVAPYLIEHNNKINVWYKQDDTFEVPKGSIEVAFHLPSSNTDINTSVMSNLAIEMLDDELNELTYFAELVGLKVKLHAWRDGFLINVSGYSHKLSNLLQEVLNNFFQFKPKQDRFESIKFKLLKNFKNFGFQVPFQQVGVYHLQLLNDKLYQQDDKIEALEKVTYEDVYQHFTQNIWQLGIFAEVLIHGNFDFAQSKQIRDIINESMENVKPWMEKYNEEQFHLQSYVLQPNETIRYEVPLKDTANINSCIEYYIQINTNTDNLKLRVLTDLFATIIREPCFDQLRTKEQLGYVVFSGTVLGRTTLGFRVLIQSERTCDYLQYRIEEFLVQFGNYINNELSTEDFIKFKHALKNIKLTKLKHLNEETVRIWSNIIDGYYDFDSRTRQVEILENITKDELVEFFNTFIAKSDNTGKLITYLKSQNPIEFTESKKLHSGIINYLYRNQIEINHELIDNLVKQYDEHKDLAVIAKELSHDINVNKDKLLKVLNKSIAQPVPEIYPTVKLVVNDKEFRKNRQLSGTPKPVNPLSKFLYNDQSHL